MTNKDVNSRVEFLQAINEAHQLVFDLVSFSVKY